MGYYTAIKKECVWVSSNEVDEPRAYCTKWGKSEKEKLVLYINACMWNLERWYWWAYMQGSSGDADIVNRLVDPVRAGEGGMNWESSMEAYILPYVKEIASGNKWWILTDSCHVESESISIPFLYSVTWKSIVLSCTLNRSFIHAWFCNNAFVVWKILVHWVIQRFPNVDIVQNIIF